MINFIMLLGIETLDKLNYIPKVAVLSFRKIFTMGLCILLDKCFLLMI